MSAIHQMLAEPMARIAEFNPPRDYLRIAGASYSTEARQLCEDIHGVLPAVVTLANRLAALLRDLEGPDSYAPRVIANADNAIVHEEGYEADLGLEVAIYREEART